MAGTVESEAERIERIKKALRAAKKKGAKVTAVCKAFGMSRAQYYRYREQYKEHGAKGLRLTPHVDRHPKKTTEEARRAVLRASRRLPVYGSKELFKHLAATRLKLGTTGLPLARSTVQKILTDDGRGTMAGRVDARKKELERHSYRDGPRGQWSEIQATDPVLYDWDDPCVRVGQVLFQKRYRIAPFFYLQLVLDAYSRYGFAYAHSEKDPASAISALSNRVLPRFKVWHLDVELVATATDSQYWQYNVRGFDWRGSPKRLVTRADSTNDGVDGLDHRRLAHAREVALQQAPMARYVELGSNKVNDYQLALDHWHISHADMDERYRKGAYIETFRRLLKKGFFGQPRRLSVEMQPDLDEWLRWYNCERTIRAYPHRGRTPDDVVQEYRASKKD